MQGAIRKTHPKPTTLCRAAEMQHQDHCWAPFSSSGAGGGTSAELSALTPSCTVVGSATGTAVTQKCLIGKLGRKLQYYLSQNISLQNYKGSGVGMLLNTD